MKPLKRFNENGKNEKSSGSNPKVDFLNLTLAGTLSFLTFFLVTFWLVGLVTVVGQRMRNGTVPFTFFPRIFWSWCWRLVLILFRLVASRFSFCLKIPKSFLILL
jgi:hypothetical protein